MQVAIVEMPQESPDNLACSSRSVRIRVGTRKGGRSEEVWVRLHRATRRNRGNWSIAGSIDRSKGVPEALKNVTTFEANLNTQTGSGNLVA